MGLLANLDPEGSLARQSHRLKRRRYCVKVAIANYFDTYSING